MRKKIDSHDETVASVPFYRFLSRAIEIVKCITVEPTSFLLMTTALINYLLSQNLILEKACKVNLNYTHEICDSIIQQKSAGNYSAEEVEIQKIASTVRTYRSIIDHSIPILIVLFLGPWSDLHGRKIPMLLPCVGAFLQSLCFMLFSWLTNVDAYTVGIVTSAVNNLCGGLTTFGMSANSFVVDRTSQKQRTVRIGILNACSTIGVPAGFAIGGALATSSLGNVYSFAIPVFLSFICFFNILILVNDARKKDTEQNDTTKPKFSAKNHVIDVAKFPFKKRENGARLKILLLIVAYVGVIAPIHGEFGVMYLFLRKQFGWNAGNYGMFSTYNFVIGFLGTVLSMGIFSHCLKMKDALLGFISGISQFTSCFVYAFAYSIFMIYLAPAIDMMNGTMAIVAKSMLSKLVQGDENGKLFSFLAVLDSLTPLVMDPTYSTLYRKTLDVFAGSFFLLSASMTVLPQIIFLWFIYRKWSGSRKEHINSEPTPPQENPEAGITNGGGSISTATSTTTVNTDYM